MEPQAVAHRAVIVIDGGCLFCERSARFIAQRDPDACFQFAANQWPAAQALLAEHGLAGGAGSIVSIEDGRVFVRSTASLRIAGRLVRPWSWLSVLLVVPRPLRDGAYTAVAAVRHRLAGPSTFCEAPPPELRARLL